MEPYKRYYFALLCVTIIDVTVFGLISVFYRPVPGTTTFRILKYGFFGPFVIVSALQLVRLFFNVVRGYVIAMFGMSINRYEFADAPFSFLFGVLTELSIWTLFGYAIGSFLIDSA